VELNKGEKVAIIKDEIRQQTALHYRFQLRARGHKAAGNQRGLDETSNALAGIEAIIDALNDELASLGQTTQAE
jgi:hypothetical protein